MNKAELTAALSIATNPQYRFIDEHGKHLEDITIFDGFGLHDFKPVTCTIRQLGFLVRWQCFQMNGNIDSTALNEIATFGRKRFQVVG